MSTNLALRQVDFYEHRSAARPSPLPVRRPALTDAELTKVCRQYRHQVLSRCRRILRDDQAAEDATQTVFLKLWRYGNSFRAAQSQIGWLYRVAERCCFDELRGRVTLADELSTERLQVAGSGGDRVEDRDLARRFLDRFDARVKHIVVLRYCEEMSQDEIAEETSWSRQTVFKKLVLVRERARALRGTLCGERERLRGGVVTDSAVGLGSAARA